MSSTVPEINSENDNSTNQTGDLQENEKDVVLKRGIRLPTTICGEVDRGGDINLRNKYKACSVRDLKRELKKLKLNGGNIREIKFVSRTLRNLLANKSDKISHNHDSYIKNNFWGYVNVKSVLMTEVNSSKTNSEKTYRTIDNITHST